MDGITERLLSDLEFSKTYEPTMAVESAIAIYQQASSAADEFSAVKDAAKKLIVDVMTATGQTAYSTKAGKASMTAPGVSVTYDAKAIDILLRDDPDLAMRLTPYRKETERVGSLRIVAAK